LGVDEPAGKYLGLTAGSHPGEVGTSSRVVKPEFALGQLETELDDEGRGEEAPPPGGEPLTPKVVNRFRGDVIVDPDRPNKAFSTITQEIVEHFTALVDADVTIRIHIEALRAEGFSDDVIRTVTENARTLRFDEGSGFEEV
jgi:hypothetical protein